MATPNIYILPRANYDAFPDKDHNIFFVRENTSETHEILSLYVGEGRQCDLLDISDVQDIDLDDPEHNYNIPIDFRIKNKLFFYLQDISVDKQDNADITETYFKMLMWDGANFLDCGIHNNVIVCENLPDRPIKNFVYIQPSIKAISVYGENEWVQLLDLSQYALASDIPQADDVTIKNTSGVFSSAINIETGEILSSVADGNVISNTNVPLSTIIANDTIHSGNYSFSYLPRNGGEERFVTNNMSYIQIENIQRMYKVVGSTTTNVDRTSDYMSVVILKKDPSVTDVTAIVRNFDTATYTTLPKIYLANPDVDISGYNVVHILFYYDGLNVCALVAGYATS